MLKLAEFRTKVDQNRLTAAETKELMDEFEYALSLLQRVNFVEDMSIADADAIRRFLRNKGVAHKE